MINLIPAPVLLAIFGAAIALATTDGTIAGDALPRPDDAEGMLHQVTHAVATSDVVVVDAGEVRDWTAPPSREAIRPPSRAMRCASSQPALARS